MTVPAQSARRHPAPVDNEWLSDLYEWFAPQRSFTDWAAEYRADLETERGEG